MFLCSGVNDIMFKCLEPASVKRLVYSLTLSEETDRLFHEIPKLTSTSQSFIPAIVLITAEGNVGYLSSNFCMNTTKVVNVIS